MAMWNNQRVPYFMSWFWPGEVVVFQLVPEDRSRSRDRRRVVLRNQVAWSRRDVGDNNPTMGDWHGIYIWFIRSLIIRKGESNQYQRGISNYKRDDGYQISSPLLSTTVTCDICNPFQKIWWNVMFFFFHLWGHLGGGCSMNFKIQMFFWRKGWSNFLHRIRSRMGNNFNMGSVRNGPFWRFWLTIINHH